MTHAKQDQIDVIALEAARKVVDVDFGSVGNNRLRPVQYQAAIQVIIAAAIKEALDNV